MIYRLQFRNIKEQLYTVDIQTGTATNLYDGLDVRGMGEPPCVIKSESNGLYAPIKSRSCTLNLLMRDYVFDLYSKTPKGTKVTVKDYNNSIIFFGYLTPCIYTQQYTYLDNVELEAVDAVSVLKEYTIPDTNRFLQLNLKDLVCSMLNEAGYTGRLYVPDTYDRLDGSSISNVFASLYASGGNFFGDDNEHLPLSYYDVLTEIMRFMGWSVCPDGMDVWLIDYRAESQGSVTYKAYTISSGSAVSGTTSKNETITISKTNNNIAGGTPSISMDDIYNKVTVSANLFEVDELAPDLDDDSIHNSVTETIEANIGTSALNISQWTKQRRKSFLWWSWNSGSPQEGTGVDYQTFCELNPSSGWEHTFYHIYNPSTSYPNINDSGTWSGCNWYDKTNAAQSSDYKGNKTNQYVNTVGCLLQHHALVPNTDNENLMPTSVNWEDFLTFFITNDTAGNNSSALTPSELRAFEVPVLKYHIGEQLNYKPRTGTNWICISGDLYLQASAQYTTSDNKTFQMNLTGGDGSNKTYVTCPIDKPEDVDGELYYSGDCIRYNTSDSNYGSGWPMWKMQLKVGNKYWNGSAWTNTASTFNINYNNSPDPGSQEAEALVGFDWMKMCSNTTYKDKVGVDGYCIPINYNESGSFVGDLTLTIYCPSILPIGHNYSGMTWEWDKIPNVIYVKDFSLEYVYTDEQVWYKQHGKSYKDDYIYTGYIDNDIPNNFSGLKLKLNTALAESPISRSFVCSSNGYISTMRHVTYSGSGQIQEKNLLDMYLDHYKEPKPIYEIDLHGMSKPWYKYSTQFIPGTFLLDSYSYDLKYDKNRVKLIAF